MRCKFTTLIAQRPNLTYPRFDVWKQTKTNVIRTVWIYSRTVNTETQENDPNQMKYFHNEFPLKSISNGGVSTRAQGTDNNNDYA